MFLPDQYELLDFGGGRKLERFGGYLLDRPCPAAEGFERSVPTLWKKTTARYQRSSGEQGQWQAAQPLPERWTIRHGPISLQLKPTEFGHLGVFPEQAANWDRIAQCIARADRPLRVLNLFAYTGASTLAAAAAGAEVTHVDAARNTVAWARSNAEQSGLSAAPIRWIAEDAAKFVERELRRGRQYDAVILDPPSYGHGVKGEVWRLEEHLAPLLAACAELTRGEPQFLLLTCHSPGYGPAVLSAALRAAFPAIRASQIHAEELGIAAADGRFLPCGAGVWIGAFPRERPLRG